MSTATATMDAPPPVAEVLAPWADKPGVRFPELASSLGVSRDARQDMLGEGLVTPIGYAGRGGQTVISHEDAGRFVSAVFLAAALGLAVVVVLRFLAGAGATVSASGVTIPVPAP